MKSLVKWILPVGLFLMFFSAILGGWFILKMREAIQAQNTTDLVYQKADQVSDDLERAENYLLVYFLTKDDSFKIKCLGVLNTIPDQIDQLLSLSAVTTDHKYIQDFQDQIGQIRKSLLVVLGSFDKSLQSIEHKESSSAFKLITSKEQLKNISQLKQDLSMLRKEMRLAITRHYSFVKNYLTLIITLSIVCIAIAALLFLYKFSFYKKEAEIRELEKEQLIKAKNKVSEASQLKTKFLAIVSHELRTPLNGIIGLSDVLQKKLINEENIKIARVINTSGKTLLRIINDILDFSSVENGNLVFDNRDFNLFDMFNQVVETLKVRAEAKKLNLVCDIDDELPLMVYGDSERLSQVLFNLIGNAIKFTHSGSVILKVKKIEDESDDREVCIQFSIEDTGIGMSETQVNELFRSFYQAHKTGTSGEPGTGLGLSISQILIRAMGGEIKVLSDLDRGSKFWFKVKFQKFSNEKINSVSHLSSQNEIVHRAVKTFNNKHTILIAEDNVVNQITIETILSKLEVNFRIVSNGKEIIESLKENQSVDLIFMDCQMPIKDGYEATREIRQMNIQIPIIAMTANTAGSDIKACFDSGMNEILLKPFTVEQIENLLEKYFKSDVVQIDDKPLAELEKALGSVGMLKIVKAFISTLPDLEGSVSHSNLENNYEQIKKTAHRFRSSSLTVGAMALAEVCRKIEYSQDCGEIEKDIPLLKQLISGAKNYFARKYKIE